MNLKLIRLSFFLLFPLYLQAASMDSLIKFGYLNFKNEFEKTAFKQSRPDKLTELTDIFLTPYQKETSFDPTAIHKKINECVSILRPLIEDKSEAKKIKTAYEYVHKTFFKVYKMENSFCDIFTKGEYNCVSATALYAIIFSKLSIPYQVKETPRHVYLVAYPNTSKILLETTSPEKGYYLYIDDFAKKYVKSLVKSKLISKEEADTSSITRLFNEHFFSSENITAVQLAGLQYSNYGLYYLDDKLDDKNYKLAIEELKKAIYLYPSDRHKYMLKQALSYEIGNNNYNRMDQVYNLVALCHFNNVDEEEISDELLRNEFLRVIQAQLITNSDYQKLDSSYRFVMEALNDTTLKNNISFDYNYELARLGLQNSKDTAYELSHLQAAYNVNPNHANLQSMLLSYFAILVEKNNDVSSVIKMMDDFARRFNFIKKNLHFNTVKANCLLELSYQNYSLNDQKAGESYIRQFEGLYNTYNGLEFNAVFIEKAYMTGAGLYYKKGNYTQSKQLVKSGLIYAPESFRLKQMLSQF